MCDIDVWHFERALGAARTRAQLEAALDQYGGSFLGDDPSPWAVGMRNRLECAVARAAFKIDMASLTPGHRDRMAPAVRHRLLPVQIHSTNTCGEHSDVGASPRCRVADRRMDRESE
jgi:Bacterial transcriptional activator domain